MAGILVETGIIFLLFFTPLAFGGTEGWALGIIHVVSALVVAAWTFGRLNRSLEGGLAPRPRAGFWLPLGLFLGLTAIQIASLPPGWVESLSPGVHARYRQGLPGYAEGKPFESQELIPWLLADQSSNLPSLPESPDHPLLNAPLAGSESPLRSSAWRSLSLYPYTTKQHLGLLISYLALFAVVTSYYTTRERLLRLCAVGAGSAALVSLFGIVQKLTWNGKLYWIRESTGMSHFGPFVDRNTYAAFAGLWMPIALSMAFNAARRGRRGDPDALPHLLLWGTAAVATGVGIFVSLSRGGIVTASFAAVLAAFLILRKERSLGAMVLMAGLVLVCIVFLWWLGPESVLERIGTLSEGTGVPSFRLRLEAWQRTPGLLWDNLFFGTGLGTFRYAFMPYAPPGEGWWVTAHNEIIEFACDTGILGLGLFSWALVLYLVQATRSWSTASRTGRYLTIGVMAGAAGVLAHSCVTSTLHVPANALSLSVLAGAILNVGRESRQPARRGLSRWVAVPLIAAAALHVVFGVMSIAGWRHRFTGERALSGAELDEALVRFGKEAWWQPGQASTYIFMGRVIAQAQANGLPLKAFAGRSDAEVFGIGLSALARGIALNPADAWGWSNLASFSKSALAGQERLHRLRAAGEAALRGNAEPVLQAPSPKLDWLEGVALAASLKAEEMEPEFHYYSDFRAALYHENGLKQEAGREVRRSMSLLPAWEGHFFTVDDDFVREMADPILEGLSLAEKGRYSQRAAALQSRAKLLIILDRYEEAMAAYEELRAIGDRAIQQLCDVELGRIELIRQRYRESLAHLSRAVEAGLDAPMGKLALLYSADSRFELGELQEAVDLYQRHVALAPDSISGYTGLARAMEAAGRSEDAEKVLLTAVRRFQDLPYAYQVLIAHLRDHGKAAAALPYAQALLKVGEDEEAAHRLIQELEEEARQQAP